MWTAPDIVPPAMQNSREIKFQTRKTNLRTALASRFRIIDHLHNACTRHTAVCTAFGAIKSVGRYFHEAAVWVMARIFPWENGAPWEG